jgi:uncharacterized protein
MMGAVSRLVGSRLLLVSALLLAAVARPLPAAAAFDVPPNDGFVTDAAGLLTETEQSDLEMKLSEYRQQTSNEIAVVTVQNLGGEEIGQAALDIHRAWRVGSQTNDNGIVVLLAYEDRQVWISVGYGLEGAVPDLTAHAITEDVMKPLFKDGKYAAGLSAGVDKLEEAIGGEYKPEAPAEESDNFSLAIVVLFVILNGFRFLGAWMAQSKSWWHGGVIGLGAGALLSIAMQWWLPLPLLILAGLGMDYFVSRYGFKPSRRRGSGWIAGSGGGWSSRGGGGGFSGFGGGSAGGGGAGSSW